MTSTSAEPVEGEESATAEHATHRRTTWQTQGLRWCKLDLSRLDLDEVADALSDQTDYDHRWLINPVTGEVVFWTSDTGIDDDAATQYVADHPDPVLP